jgi:hypothetical protein
MLRCAASFVIAAYVQVLLIPQDLRALPQGAFYAAVVFGSFFDFLRIRHVWRFSNPSGQRTQQFFKINKT